MYGLALETALTLPCARARGAPSRRVRLAPAGAASFARLRPRTGSAAREWFYCRRLESGATYLRWTDLFEFLVSSDGRDIRDHPLPQATPESLATYLLSQVLSFSLLAFGTEPLHGTVAVVDGEAIGFLGDCGAGKSTLGAAFLRLGCPILTDDLVALERTASGYSVHPGVPRIKLFPSVAQRVLGVSDGGERLNTRTSKRILRLRGPQASWRLVPLRALYVLAGPTSAARRAPSGIAIARLSPAAACLELIRHTFNTIVTDRERLARQFTWASEVAAAVPVRQLRYPRNLSRLPEVCEAVLADEP